MPKIQESADGGNAHAEGDYSYAEGGPAGDSSRGPGGDGGHSHAIGAYSTAVAGRGGRGGVGKGGPGGDAIALGEGHICYGGDGGESSQHDGRGGRGGVAQMLHDAGFKRRAAMKLPYGEPNTFPGRGGDTPDTPQYMARRLIVERIKADYYIEHGIPTEGAMLSRDSLRMVPEDWRHALTAKYSDVWYDREVVPLIWINEQLRQAGNAWTGIPPC